MNGAVPYCRYHRRTDMRSSATDTPVARGHELSEGRYIGMGWLDRRDLMRWISLIVQAGPHARIVLHGVSMGATEVMMTAGEPDLPGNVCAAIEDCGFASVWDQFADNAVSMYHLPQRWMAMPALAGMSLFSRRKAGYGFRQASSVAQLAHATVPMLFIHGTDDAFVDPRQLDRNVAACSSERKERLVVPGAGHAMSASTDPERYWSTVDRFVSDALAG